MSNSIENGNERRRMIVTRHTAKLLESSGVPISSLFVSIPYHKQPKTLISDTNAIADSEKLIDGTDINTKFELEKKLDTKIFESYLEDLWNKIPMEKKMSCTCFDSLWFTLYKGGSKTKVLQWIQKKQIFLRKYIFVPIICWKHWSLLILCNFGEQRKSKTKQPCMLLLDSLHNLGPNRLEPQIRRLVRDIYRTEERKETDEFISKIPLLIPKVPQQRSNGECGIFVLYFLYLFLQSAPDAFSQEGYPYFLTEDWFKLDELESFGNEIHRLCMSKDSMDIEPEECSESE